MGDDSLVGTTIDGRYHIESILGAGGMGRVYLARHNILHKQLALKVLHPELVQNRSLAQRFIREAQAASSIVSDHVVAIFDFGVMPGGATYFVMEHLAGETLHDRIRASGALLPEEVATFGAHIARGLQAAHDKGIIHRDLKPDNVVITSGPGGRPVCKILDFGIAKSPTSDTTEQLTRIGAAMGTPPYMAPEQIDGTAVDARCDVYALGVVLYEMATGRVPFISRSAVQIFAMHRWQAPVPVRQTRYGQACSAALAQVIHRCLAKDPADRFPTAADVGVALEAETPPPQH